MESRNKPPPSRRLHFHGQITDPDPIESGKEGYNCAHMALCAHRRASVIPTLSTDGSFLPNDGAL